MSFWRLSMRFIRCFLAAAAVFTLIGAPLFAQVQSIEDIETPTPQFQDHGGVTPWFWIGVQTVFSAGYNMETTAGGFRNYGGDDHTYASFNLAFVDSHYQTSKFYEVPRELDPDAWTGHFVMLNFTSRLNSWNGGNTVVMENNVPAWLAEITGKGARIGFFTQAGNLIGGVDDTARTGDTDNKPIIKILGGNKVIDLRANQLGKLYYEKDSNDDIAATFTTTDGAIMYGGYEKKELWNVYLTMLSQGNVDSDVTDGNNKGFAGVVDFGVSPFGLITDDERPLTFNITGNAITGFNWKGDTRNARNNFGFGLKAEAGYWLWDNFVLAPVIAFDGKSFKQDNKTGTPAEPEFTDRFNYKVGGGLTFQFSGMRWVSDDWGDLYNKTNASFANHRYENNQVLKFAYAQVYAAYSEFYDYNVKNPIDPGFMNKDFNILFRVEEPDGEAGFHDKLGAMLELRLSQLNKFLPDTPMKWETQGRVSWDVNLGQYLVTPYLRAYLNDDAVFKLRIGAYANFIPFTGFELAYTSANLNKGASPDVPKPMSHYETIFDAGRIELIVILKSDNIRPQVPKRMSDWNYPATIQDY